MDSLLQVGLSNAAVATVLALVASIVSLVWRRRPALVHGLWLLVLLKLLTPPLARIPIPGWTTTFASTPAVAVKENEAPAATATHAEAELDFAEMPSALAAETRVDDGHSTPEFNSSQLPRAHAPAESSISALAVPENPPVFDLPDWRPLLVTAWLLGTVGWFLLAGIRLARFARLLRYAVPAPARVQDEADRIAAALGMRWCPGVELVPGRVAPMVWSGLGAPRLLLPADLLGQVSAAGVTTLMAHELAHLRRGDHHVRLVEFMALGLFWWHPVVWLARRSLREAEEQCCDAWVVSALPGAGKTYATALVETLDFLSTAPAAPPLACGIGQVSDLKRRLTMIMRGATPRALCWREGLAVLGLATLLPLLPTLARAEPEESNLPVPAARSDVDTYVARLDEKASDGDKAKDELERLVDEKARDVEKAKAELKQLEAELQRKVREVREVSQRLKEAAEKIHRAEFDKVKDKMKDIGEKKAKEIKERIMKEIRVEVDGKEIKGVEVDGKEMKGRKLMLDGPIEIEITTGGQTRIHRLDGAQLRVVPPVPAVGTVPAVPAAPPVSPAPAARATPAPEARAATSESSQRAKTPARRTEGREEERRMDQLERKLDAVVRELERLRKEKADSQKKAAKPGRSEQPDDD
jgi:bla regulator protein BlaR1